MKNIMPKRFRIILIAYIPIVQAYIDELVANLSIYI